MREAAPNDFALDVEGIGNFIFGRRTGRDRFRIAAEFHRLTEGLQVGESEFGLAAESVATIRVLMVEGPDDIKPLLDLDAPSTSEQDGDAKLLRVFFALRQKELSFRSGSREAVARDGKGAVGDAGILVSPEVQPVAA